MGNKIHTVAELVHMSPEEATGIVTVKGWLVCEFEGHFLYAWNPDASLLQSPRIQIDDPLLLKALFGEVPAKAGTKYYYSDSATVTGHFVGGASPN